MNTAITITGSITAADAVLLKTESFSNESRQIRGLMITGCHWQILVFWPEWHIWKGFPKTQTCLETSTYSTHIHYNLFNICWHVQRKSLALYKIAYTQGNSDIILFRIHGRHFSPPFCKRSEIFVPVISLKMLYWWVIMWTFSLKKLIQLTSKWPINFSP